uniref:N-acylglucosamine-6-phosphate 2-epimerase n=1 Tax=Fervidobacterium nodosum TaxID=2424 RepID=A0A7C5U3E1_9BACT
MTKKKGIDCCEIIVSCQAAEDEPLRDSYIISMLAYAVNTVGIKYIRANGPEDISEIKKRTDAYVVGIMKDAELLAKGCAFITVRKKDIEKVVKAGANAVAIDCTRRERPEPLEELFTFTRDNFPDIEIIADISDLDDAKEVLKLKPDYIATTLSGYTSYTSHRILPDLELVDELKKLTDIPIIAEGGYTSPWEVRQALLKGAYAVVVGSALTRPHVMAKKFIDSTKDLKNAVDILGVDIGGTYIRFVLMNKDGNIKWTNKIENPQEPNRIVESIGEQFFTFAKTNPITHLGIATAGRVESESGVISFASENIKNWSGFPLKKKIAEFIGLTPVVENDANAATFAQWLKSPVKNMVLITVGTGLGAGAFVDGKLIHGKSGGAMELGHITYPGNDRKCTCGKIGCVETLLRAEELSKLVTLNSENLKEKAKIFAWLLDVVKAHIDFQEAYLHGVVRFFGNEFLQYIRDYYKTMFSYNSEEIKYSDIDEYGGALGAGMLSLYYGSGGVRLD